MVRQGSPGCCAIMSQVSKQLPYMKHSVSVVSVTVVLNDPVVSVMEVGVTGVVVVDELEVAVEVQTGDSRGWSKQYFHASVPSWL
jgi:hypothetical protein